jgi:hypothetical protein
LLASRVSFADFSFSLDRSLRGEMTFTNLSANLLTVFSGGILMLQTAGATSPDITGIIGPIERLTLVGALIIAVRVLWGSNSRKDIQIIEMATKVTETMVSVMDAVKELRKATEEIGAAMDNLAENVAAMRVPPPRN